VRFERAGRYYEFGRSQWELSVAVASGQWGMPSVFRSQQADSIASFALGPPPTAPDQSPITRTSTITISRLPKKLCDKGLFFQELADRGVDLVATEIIQTHVLHHFAAVITGGPDRERADDPLLHSVAAI
jgi:hypothetical protein